MKCLNCIQCIEEDGKHYCIEDEEYIQQEDVEKDYCMFSKEVE